MIQKKDFIAEAIADYEALKPEEKGGLLLKVMQDQPVLIGFLTNLADDFEDVEHDVLVDSTVILINAFIGAGIPVGMIARQMVEEVIDEKVESYEQLEKEDKLDGENIAQQIDSPKVFDDLKNRAIFKALLNEAEPDRQHNFILILDTVITIIERSVADEIDKAVSQ